MLSINNSNRKLSNINDSSVFYHYLKNNDNNSEINREMINNYKNYSSNDSLNTAVLLFSKNRKMHFFGKL